jgi:Protein of unknown function (DUF732)
MRDRETIDSELRRLAAERRSSREHGGELSSRQLDRLLDERLGHRPDASGTEATEVGATTVVADTWSSRGKAHDITPYRRKRVLRRFGLPTVLPLSLAAIAAASIAVFAVHYLRPPAAPTEVASSGGRPTPAAQKPAAQVPPAPPVNHAPPPNIVDKAFIDVLQQEGVPVPSREYALAHGHGVCEFLEQQPDLPKAIRFVQRSSIWDANQSSNFAAGAVVSFCPQYEPKVPNGTQQPFQDSLSKLRDIEGDLQGINGDLQGIRDGLQPGG